MILRELKPRIFFKITILILFKDYKMNINLIKILSRRIRRYFRKK